MLMVGQRDFSSDPDFKTDAYWWRGRHPPARPLPAQADVWWSARLYRFVRVATCCSGRQVLVLDAENLGAGASSRNAARWVAPRHNSPS